MELRHLHYFIAVAEELHFSRAAKRLHISQPPLSQQIRGLEDELGVKLFERTKRQVQLTEAGKVFLERSYLVLAQLEQAIEVTQRVERGEVGRLAIGFVGSATYTVLPDILSVFREQFPAVELRLHELTTQEQIQALHHKQVNVGIVRSAIIDPGLSIECVLQESLVLALPQSHPLSAQAKVSLSALADELFILFPAKMGPIFYEQIINICQEAGFRPKVAQEAVQMQTIIGLVAAGLGIGLIDAGINTYIVQDSRSANMIGLLHAFYGIGALSGAAIATTLLSLGTNWRQIYWVLAGIVSLLIVSVLGAIISWFLRLLASPPASPVLEQRSYPVEQAGLQVGQV